MVLFHPKRQVLSPHLIDVSQQGRQGLNRGQRQVLRCIRAQEPFRSVPPKRRLVRPAVVLVPIPRFVRRRIPTQLVPGVKRPVVEATEHHVLLGHVQGPLGVVVQGQRRASLSEESHVLGDDLLRLNARFEKLIVTQAMHAFLRGGKREPRTLSPNTFRGPISSHPRLELRRGSEDGFDGRQPLPLSVLKPNHTSFATQHPCLS